MSDYPVSPAALSAAIDLLGGPAAPLRIAAKRLHWPCVSRAALHNRLAAGTLPVRPRKLGGRWYVLAADLAIQLADPAAFGRLDVQAHVTQAPVKGGPGRPRKRAGGGA